MGDLPKVTAMPPWPTRSEAADVIEAKITAVFQAMPTHEVELEAFRVALNNFYVTVDAQTQAVLDDIISQANNIKADTTTLANQVANTVIDNSITPAIDFDALGISTVVKVTMCRNSNGVDWIDKSLWRSGKPVKGVNHGSLTTTQKNALTPLESALVYDSSLGVWQTYVVNNTLYTGEHYGNTNNTWNTTTTGNSLEFPVHACVIAKLNKVYILDLTQSEPVIWAILTSGTNYYLRSFNNISSVSMIDGVLVVTDSVAGMIVINLIKDICYNYRTDGKYVSPNSFVDRNVSGALIKINSTQPITSQACKSVTTVVLPNAPINSDTGMPVVTIAVGTSVGVNIIDGPAGVGTIKTSSYALTVGNVLVYAGSLYFQRSASAWGYDVVDFADLVSDGFTGHIYTTSSTPSVGQTSSPIGTNTGLIVSIGAVGISTLKENPSSPSDGMVAYIATDFATPLMLGDVEVCLTGNDLIDRCVTSTTITDAGTATFTTLNNGDLKYITAVGGAITATVTTGGKCYGWELISGTWVFREAIADWTGVSETGDTLTIADGTSFTQLCYTNTTPSNNQLAEIKQEGINAQKDKAKIFLQGASDACLGVAYDESTDLYTVAQADYINQFKGLTNVNSYADKSSTATSIATLNGTVIEGGGKANITIPKMEMRSELMRPATKKERDEEFWFDNYDNSVAFNGVVTGLLTLKKGWKPIRVQVNGSTKRKGSSEDYVVNFDNYAYAINYNSALATSSEVLVIVEKV